MTKGVDQGALIGKLNAVPAGDSLPAPVLEQVRQFANSLPPGFGQSSGQQHTVFEAIARLADSEAGFLDELRGALDGAPEAFFTEVKGVTRDKVAAFRQGAGE